jgi:hypothetical protein
MAADSYSTEQVTKALLALAANSGDAKLTAAQLSEGDFQISEATLLLFKHEEHAERYGRFEKELAAERERRTVSVLQETIVETSRIKLGLIEKVEASASRPELAGHALRAMTDAEAKSVNNLLALTGRPTDGKQEGGVEHMVRMVEGMAARGYLSLASGLSLEAPQRVPNQAESERSE